MKIIILAAGRGERLMPLTQNTPKPLIDMGNGNTLLEEQMHNIKASGAIDEIVVVVGYLAEQVDAKISSYRARGFKVSTVFNPFWQVSNNLMSLWLARQTIVEGDTVITNGDNIFTPEVFAGLAAQGDGIWLTASPKSDFDPDDMKVTVEKGLVAHVSKTPTDKAFAESPGLVMVHGERARGLFLENLEGTVRDLSNINRFWLEVFNRMWAKGVAVHPWNYDVRGKWQEVDFHLDLKHARKLVEEKAVTFTRL